MSPVGLRELVYRYRGALLAPPLLAALLLEPRGGPGDWVAGVTLFAAGGLLRIWAGQHVRYRLDDAHRLATAGPYRWLRNPVYLGTILLCAGAVATAGRPWLAAATAAWCALVYLPVVRFEEEHLEQKFGADYRDYRRRVPRWLPRPSSGPPGLVTGHLGAAIRAEAGTLLLIVPFVIRALI